MNVSITLGAEIPAGLVLDYAGSTAPTGWLFLDGSEVSQTTYANLYSVIGSAYNTGSEGAGNFRLPDTRGRISVGAGTGAGLTARALGDKFGAETHQLTEAELPSHTHTQNAHSHSANVGTFDRDYYGSTNANSFSNAGTTTGSTTATNNPSGGDQAHNNVMPGLVLNKIIKF